jgi:hypothetical protein
MPLWMTNADRLILHHTILQDDGEYHKVFIPSSNPLTQKTQSGQCFNSKMVVDGRSEFQSYASITPLQQGQVLLHSSVPMYINPIPISGFEETIKNMANQTLCVSILTWNIYAATQHLLTRRNFIFSNSLRGFWRSLEQRSHFFLFY